MSTGVTMAVMRPRSRCLPPQVARPRKQLPAGPGICRRCARFCRDFDTDERSVAAGGTEISLKSNRSRAYSRFRLWYCRCSGLLTGQINSSMLKRTRSVLIGELRSRSRLLLRSCGPGLLRRATEAAETRQVSQRKMKVAMKGSVCPANRAHSQKFKSMSMESPLLRAKANCSWRQFFAIRTFHTSVITHR